MQKSILGISIVLGVLAAMPLLANEQSKNKKIKKAENIETVLVQGHKTTANDLGAFGDKKIIDTPFSITVIDAEDLSKRGAKSVRQIFINDAAFYTPASSNTTDWWGMTLRGMPVRNTYADDYPVLLHWGGDFPVEVVESVTALKGATGFMYGFGSPGGAVSYKLKKPQDVAHSSFETGVRSNSVLSAHLDTGGLIADDLKYRFNLAGENGTAYNAAGVNREIGSFGIEKDFGEKLEWITNVIFEHSTLEHEPYQIYMSEYDIASSDGKMPNVTYDYDDFNVDDSFYETETLIASTGFKYHLNDNWQLKYQYGYSRKEHDSNKSFVDLYNREGDYGGNIYNFAGILANYFSQAMLFGNLFTGEIKHEIVAGVGYQKSTSQYGPFYYASTPEFFGNLFEEQTFLLGQRPDLTLNPVGSETRQTYGFLSDTLHFNHQWQLILGARHTYYDREDLNPSPAINSGYNTTALTPTIALIYKPSLNSTIYASYVEGLEPGSIVGTRYANRDEVLDARVSNQYEIGTKYQEGKLSLDAAIFKVERAETMDVTRNGLLYLTQDGLTTFQGIELNSAYQFTDNLKMGVGVVNLDASIDDVSFENRTIEGNRPPNAAEWQYAANAEYSVPAIEGLSLRLVYRYYGDVYLTNFNQLKVPDYSIVNTGFSYEFKLWNRDATLNGNINNLLNEKYWAGGGNNAAVIGEAFNGSIGLQARW
ncbi:MAG TPA: TonB-dependent siderophore receptor [Cellvibrio sp.]|nr:TonB-dependent siderophore receptor [Cellvibrio sp.]